MRVNKIISEKDYHNKLNIKEKNMEFQKRNLAGFF